MTRWALVLALGLTAVAAADDTKAKAVKFDVHSGYFESNRSGLKGESSYLAFSDPTSFKNTFGTAFVMGKRPNVLPKDAFDTKVVAAVIKRGTSIYQYKVKSATTLGKTLTVTYSAEERPGGGTARFASPLIVSVPKGDYKEVVFVENGKKAGGASFKK
jgi:hypothetical protein